MSNYLKLFNTIFKTPSFVHFRYDPVIYIIAENMLSCNFVMVFDVLWILFCMLVQYARAKTAETKQNLFAVLLDFVLHDLMQAAVISEKQPPSIEEVQAVVSALCLADAPESFALAFKQGLQGVGEGVAKSIVTAMARDVTNGRLNAQVHMSETFFWSYLLLSM